MVVDIFFVRALDTTIFHWSIGMFYAALPFNLQVCSKASRFIYYRHWYCAFVFERSKQQKGSADDPRYGEWLYSTTVVYACRDERKLRNPFSK
jgi:hypothetical protein